MSRAYTSSKRRRGSPHLHQSANWALPASGDARVVIVADTHSKPHPSMLERVAAQEPDLLLHAGDIGDLSVLEELRELAPLIAVRGNIDERGEDLPDSIALELTLAGEAHFSLLLTHIALRGPRLLPRVAERAQQDACALVVCGHSHIPFLGKDRGLGIFNPGSVGPRRFHLPITLGVMALRDSTLSLRHVDVESGETWSP